MRVLLFAGILVLLFFVLFVFSLCKMAGRQSRDEEKTYGGDIFS